MALERFVTVDVFRFCEAVVANCFHMLAKDFEIFDGSIGELVIHSCVNGLFDWLVLNLLEELQ